jgi:hypothetical protein
MMEIKNEKYIKMLENAIKSFSDEISLIHYYKLSSVRSFKRNLQIKLKLNGEAYSSSKMHYKDILNNEDNVPLGVLSLSNDNLIEHLKLHHNSELRWLLVEAYELYQKYIDEIYAILGLYDKNIWSIERKNSKEIHKKEYDCIEDIKILIKEGSTRYIKIFDQLIDLRNFINNLYSLEQRDEDYFFIIVLISELRHNIVHNQGFIKQDELRKKIKKPLKKRADSLNLNNELENYLNGEDKYSSYISSFFGKNKYEDMICVTNIPMDGSTYEDRFMDDLICPLISYTKLIHKLLINKLD